MKNSKVVSLAVMLVIMLVFTGCSGTKVEEIDKTKVSEYSDEMAENLLAAINEESYEKYSRDFDETMKKAINEKEFEKTINIIRENIGDYISKSLTRAERVIDNNDEYTVAYYTAKFSKEPEDVSVKVVFSEADGKRYVTGLWFDSPNLRKK